MIESPTDERPVAAAERRETGTLSDEQLLLEYRATGKASLFAQLVRRYESELHGYLRRYLGDASAAEDAFQLTFLQVHLKCGQFQAGRKVRPWLYTIATHQAIDAQRRNRRHRMASLDLVRTEQEGDVDAGNLLELLAEDRPGPTQRLELAERRDWVTKAIGDLPDGLRAAITLVYFQGLRYREAADVLSIPVGTVKSRLNTAISRLHEAYSQAA
jgi:RNA polymerase sigma-70 factor (ECF subfamily)